MKAVIFDVDGTLADTERDGHRTAFNIAFAMHGLDVSWDPQEYGQLLQITGGRRRIAHDLRVRGYGEVSDQLAAAVHRTKTGLFRDLVLGGEIVARPGLTDLLADLSHDGIRIAIATTGRRAWVQPLVERIVGDRVDAMVTGDDVAALKPDPEVYLRALEELGVSAEGALAMEDSAVGLQAARTAGLATVVITTDYTAGQDFTGATAVRADYLTPRPLRADECRLLHHTWWAGRTD